MAGEKPSLFKYAITALLIFILLRISIILTLIIISIYFLTKNRKSIAKIFSKKINYRKHLEILFSVKDKPIKKLIEVNSVKKKYIVNRGDPYYLLVDGFKVTAISIISLNQNLMESSIVNQIISITAMLNCDVDLIISFKNKDKYGGKHDMKNYIVLKYTTYALRLSREKVYEIRAKILAALKQTLDLIYTIDPHTIISIKDNYMEDVINV